MSFRVPIELDDDDDVVVLPPPRHRHRVLIEDGNDDDVIVTEEDDTDTVTISGSLVEQLRDLVVPAARPISKVTLRKRRQRERDSQKTQADPTIYQQQDWEGFLDPDRLPQRGGFDPDQIGRVVVKELGDNGLDEGAVLTWEYDAASQTYTISDNGPGIAPDTVPRLYCVNRPLMSRKSLKRQPLRGALGNGLRVVMGAVAAYRGSISVTTRGHRQTLKVNPLTGNTEVEADELVPLLPGTTVEISLPDVYDGSEGRYIDLAIAAAQGEVYSGPAQPAWYTAIDFASLFRGAPGDVAEVLAEVFGLENDDHRPAQSLDANDIAQLHAELLQRKWPRVDIGCIGEALHDDYYYYLRNTGTAVMRGDRRVPYSVECWVDCNEGGGESDISLLLNRSPSLAQLYAWSGSVLEIKGCGLDFAVRGAKRADYDIHLCVIAPCFQYTSDGKEPALACIHDAIRSVVTKTAAAAYRNMVKPPQRMTFGEALEEDGLLEKAYRKVAENPGGDPPMLPAGARQIMYVARPLLLEATGAKSITDKHFTQTLLPDFIKSHPNLCADWDVVYDARGELTEPHTRRTVPLGTVDVRQYLGERPAFLPVAKFPFQILFPTSGPENRYENLTYIEKEGFDQLLAASRLYERFDMPFASNKGMSVTALRELIDALIPRGLKRVFGLHDFDKTGFSIVGTLTTSGRRYIYNNKVEMIDIGLRLTDVKDEKLVSEPVDIIGNTKKDKIAEKLRRMAATLRRHGATAEEIKFLLGASGTGRDAQRVELNAMTSRQFVDFITRKLTEHGVEKVIPDADVLEKHARLLTERKLFQTEIETLRPQITDRVTAYVPPDDLKKGVTKLLKQDPYLSWDEAVAMILNIEEQDEE